MCLVLQCLDWYILDDFRSLIPLVGAQAGRGFCIQHGGDHDPEIYGDEMNQKELAEKAVYMQRDYTNAEIAQLLEMRPEDLTALINAYKSGKLEEEKESEVPKLRTHKKTTRRSK